LVLSHGVFLGERFLERSDQTLSCFRWSYVAFIGVGIAALSALGGATSSQAGELNRWDAAPRAVAYCYDMSSADLASAIQNGECLDLLKHTDIVAPAEGPKDETPTGPSKAKRSNTDLSSDDRSNSGSSSASGSGGSAAAGTDGGGGDTAGGGGDTAGGGGDTAGGGGDTAGGGGDTAGGGGDTAGGGGDTAGGGGDTTGGGGDTTGGGADGAGGGGAADGGADPGG
jgi:hypothetical protein